MNWIRGTGVALVLFLSHMAAPADAACENIVAVSWVRAEYMLLDPVTLATLRVGDLRWLGIHSVNFAARGSTFERAVLNSFDFLRVNSEDAVIEVDPNPWTSSAFTTISLKNMGEELRSQDDMPIRDSEIETAGALQSRIEWADWIQEDTLIREIYDRDQYYIEGYELLDPEFNVLRRWEPSVGFNMGRSGLPSCLIDDRIYFIDRGRVQEFDNQGGTIYELEDLQSEGLRLVTPHTKNCMALAFRDTPDDNPMFGAVVFDVVAGTWGPEFAVHKFGEYILFDGGRRLLQQKQEGRIVVANPDFRYRSPGSHTNQFSLIDTATGEVLLERELETGTGELSREMLCDNETPRAFVQEGNTMHLIDPNTLEVTASRAMPEGWGSGYVIFE